jgi:hypothetical protein
MALNHYENAAKLVATTNARKREGIFKSSKIKKICLNKNKKYISVKHLRCAKQ